MGLMSVCIKIYHEPPSLLGHHKVLAPPPNVFFRYFLALFVVAKTHTVRVPLMVLGSVEHLAECETTSSFES